MASTIKQRLILFLRLHQCTATKKIKGGGFVCCVRNYWHFGPHKDYSGKEFKGKRLKFKYWD